MALVSGNSRKSLGRDIIHRWEGRGKLIVSPTFGSTGQPFSFVMPGRRQWTSLHGERLAIPMERSS